MIYRNKDGHYPSLLVKDGETVHISTKNACEIGIPILRMRPRTTAALLVLAGQPQPKAPRLSDHEAFEQIESNEGFVNLFDLDQDGRIDGYSVPFIRWILDALDPNENIPPKSVKRFLSLDNQNNNCGCSSKKLLVRNAKISTNSESINATAFAEASQPTFLTHSVRESFVPNFLVNLEVFSLFTRLGDIVVGRNATLILDSDISFAIADNFLAYKGARIIQQAKYLNLDVTATMRGSITQLIHHTVSDLMTVDWHKLTLQAPTKP